MMNIMELEEEKGIHYSPVSDVLYFLFADEARSGSHNEEALPGVHVEYDEEGKVIGFEVLNASRVLKEFVRKTNASVSLK